MANFETNFTLREKWPYTELFWFVFSRIQTRITPNMDTFYAVLMTLKTLNLSKPKYVISNGIGKNGMEANSPPIFLQPTKIKATCYGLHKTSLEFFGKT